MQIEQTGFSFSAPVGYQDQTNYTFKSAEEDELVAIFYDWTTPRCPTLEEVMQDRLEGAKAAYGEIQLEPKVETKFLGRTAYQVSFTYQNDGRPTREWWLFAPLAEQQQPTEFQYVQMVFAGNLGRKTLATTYAHITGSAALLAEAQSDKAKTAGFIRHTAGFITLELPARLAPPSVFLYVSPQQSERISLTAFDARTGQPPPLLPAQEMEEEAKQGASISEKQESSSLLEGGGVLHLRYLRSRRRGPVIEQKMVYRARITLTNGIILTLTALADPANPRLEAAVNQLIKSIKVR